MLQISLQDFPAMMRQIGGDGGAEQPVSARGKQARLFTAARDDQSSGTGVQSRGVSISEVSFWIHVIGPEQNVAQAQQAIQAVLGGLQL